MRTAKRRFLQGTAAGAAIALLPGPLRAVPANRIERSMQKSNLLHVPWQFREAGTGDWLPATVPGTVHTDLLAAGKIADPFYRTNERDLQWIDKKEWEYRIFIEIDDATLVEDHIELAFAGLDTFAEVSFNGVLVLRTDNMFRRWVVDVKEHAKAGQNELRVLLRSPVAEGLKALEANGYPLPAVVDWSEIGGLGDKHVSMFVRKAGYHFGWDWGPRFVTSGIWRPVSLKAWSGIRIAGFSIVQDQVSSASAELTAVFEIYADSAGPATLAVHSPDDTSVAATTRVMLSPGANSAKICFKITNPRLWWSNGLGTPALYRFEGRLVTDAATDSYSLRTGLRSLKIVQQPDAEGISFAVELNGVPVFMKGANYIPNDSFLPRVTKADYQRVVQSAVAAHMNMLRVWGGGIYEDDAFYDLCDENGILVWQDFMFACVMYPGGKDFLNNVRAEAADNIRRLRHHPCIALWCGNNEIDMAWQQGIPGGGWKWKENYTETQRAEIWAAYTTIFHEILPRAVAINDPQRFYWPSSPVAAWDGKTARHADITTKKQSGDIHYWGVWWAQMPFSIYRQRIGRFMSEYGFQSFPEMRTIEAYTVPEDHDILSEVMKAHQRSYIGNGTIKTYMERDYKVPADFRQFLYVGQVLQAEGVRVAMEAHRARMPFCMGSLFWQINDCWPVASWSSIDYYGRWKALHYFARKSFAPELVTSSCEDGMVQVSVVSDRLESTPAELTLRMMDFYGTILKTVKRRLRLRSHAAQIAFKESVESLLAGVRPDSVVMRASLTVARGVVAEDLLYFRPVKELALPAATPQMRIKPLGNEFAVGLTAPVLVKNLYLDVDGDGGFFSDNYFDLLPRRTKVVHYKPAAPLDTASLKRRLRFLHMAGISS